MKPSLPLLALVLLPGLVPAQTVTVTTDDDLIDIDPWSATVADLPGPDGLVSFSEAMIATNRTAGHQTIGFAIPQSDWNLQFLYPGRAVLTSLSGYYWNATDEVTIDGTTQTAFTGDTNPDGNEVAIYGFGLDISLSADRCTLLGFDHAAVTVGGSFGLVDGNTEMNITVYGGSGSTIRGNTGGTIKLDRSSDNLVVGNTATRVRVLGWASAGQPARNNRIGGPLPGDRNFITGYGTWSGEGYPSGTTVQLADTVGVRIENNWIGTTPDGLSQGSQASTVGIGFEGDNRDALIRDNRIAGILGHGTGPHWYGALVGWGILVSGSGAGIDILGNTIGLDANGQPLLGSVWGIDVGNPVTHASTVSDIRIGGPLPGEGNVVAGHLQNGVTVGRDVPQVRLQGTTIYANGALGIDLVPTGYGYGVTPNDPLDLDTGGNGLQNFPVIRSAAVEGAGTRVRGALDTSPLGQFSLEFFASPEAHASGHGEGEQSLGATTVTTDGAGHAAFDLLLPVGAPPGWVVAATATLEPLGATSEFSQSVAVDGISLALLGDLVRGSSVDLEVTGALAGEAVWFLSSLAGTGSGPCVSQLGGLCLDLLAPIRTLGAATAGAGGVATHSGTVPPNAPLVDVHLQAVIRRGLGGQESVKSGAVTGTIR